MSTTTPTAAALPPAPWKTLFNAHLSSLKSPEFVLGTLASAPSGSPTPLVPRVRYCIHRGFFAELPENKHNTAPRNPAVYQSDCPTFTTDVRMEKVGQIFATSAGHAESSFKNPPPGQRVEEPYDDKNLALGSKADDLNDPVARKNFRLVVIVPDEVEQTDLSDPEKGRRYRYTFDESAKTNGGWRTEELWP
ncbi:Pyridox-oxase-2 multi-domain protein [Pyrenophora tritici-repentis]|nr:Pyridox-oxase-2 multi-domain protein [Pyrenophora tritici-repentis]